MSLDTEALASSARSGAEDHDTTPEVEGPDAAVARRLSDPPGLTETDVAPEPFYALPGEEDDSGEPAADATGEVLPSTSEPEDYEGEDGAPEARARWFDEPREYPTGAIDTDAVGRAAREATEQDLTLDDAVVALDAIPNAPATRWRFMGPGNFSGRVNSIAVDPNNSARLYLCTSSGGAWRSTDGGRRWVEMANGITTNFGGTVAVDPNSSARIYVGTGDKDIWRIGTGLFVSTNWGQSFTRTGLNGVDWVSGIAIRRSDWRTMLVSSNRGVHRSTDGGATFTWTFNGQVDDIQVNPSNQNDVWIGARGSGVWRSTNGGVNWNRDAGPGPGSDSSGDPIAFSRVRISMCAGSPGEIYASFAVGDSAQIWRRRGSDGTWSALPDSPQAGWNQLWYNHYVAVHPTNPDRVYSGQGTIYRSNFGGRRIWGRFSSWFEIASGGGDEFTRIHVDHHCLTLDPRRPDTAYAGCDGGIYKSTVGGPSWTYIGSSIPSSEFYALGQGTSEHYQVGGGTQDNGTWTTDGAVNRWVHALGGDGFDFIVDPANINRVYAETQGLRVYRSESKGRPGTFATKISGIHPGDRRPWFAKLALSPTRTNQLFVGSDRVYRSTNRGDSWTRTNCGRFVSLVSDRSTDSGTSPAVTSRILVESSSTADAALGINGRDVQAQQDRYARLVTSSEPFAITDGSRLDLRIDNGGRQRVVFRRSDFGNIGAATAVEVSAVIDAQTSGITAGPSTKNDVTALEVARNTSAAVYAASRADFYRSTNSGMSWARLGSGLPNRWIADIAVTGTHWYRLAASVSGTGTPHVYYSANGGANWVARSSGLPDSPASTIEIDPTNEARWWVGTDVGVYVTTNYGVTWARYSTGLPRVVISDLALHRNTGLLRASTYGRGIWERQATDPRIWYRGLRTASSGVSNRRTFRRTVDALSLTMDLSATQDLIDLGLTYDAMFQIVDPRTNRAVRTVWTRNERFQHGRNWWISRGTNWGPSSGWTTPARWGIGVGLWLFRASVSVNGADPFDLAEDVVFEVV